MMVKILMDYYKKLTHKQKLTFLKITLLILSIVLCGLLYFNSSSSVKSVVVGITYYVSPSGKDSNSGTSASSPWQTINKVNTIVFKPGDQLLFEGGQTFTGKLYFDSVDQGDTVNPVQISAYGSGRATITSSTSALYAYNTGGYHIYNLNFVGTGSATNQNHGVQFYTDLPNDVKVAYVHIDNVEVSGFGGDGILLSAWNNNTGYKDVDISHIVAHDNAIGVAMFGKNMYVHENINVAFVNAYNNLGTCGTSPEEGHGIMLGNVSTALVEHSVTYNNGSKCFQGGGAVGIWTYDSKNVLIQYNESYGNKTGGSKDGDGFDFDQNVSNSLVQYNYSHNNDGAGYLMSQAPDNRNNFGNVIRYNISENDSRKVGYGAIHLYGRFINTEIYNNTVYLNVAPTGAPRAVSVVNWTIPNSDVEHVHFRNNIFQTAGGVPLVEVTTDQLNGSLDLLFQGNDYYASGSAFAVKWGSINYATLDAWRNTTGQEKNNSVNTGYALDPQLTAAGSGGTSAYTLRSSSPMINAGLNLQTLFGVNPGARDYYANTIPQGNAYDIGAYESSFTPTPSLAPTLTSKPVSPTVTPTLVTSSLLPAADTYVRSDSASSNYGKSTTIQTYTSSASKIIYMKFDLTALVGKQLASAKLRMYVSNGSSNAQSVKSVADTAWGETTIKYSNRPTIGAVFASFTPGTTTKVWREVDVTTYFAGKVGALASLAIESAGSDTYAFDAKEFSTTSLRPVLAIQYR